MVMRATVHATLLFLCVITCCLTSRAKAQAYLFNGADFLIGANPSGVAVADFNNDGALDAVVSDSVQDTLSVLLGTSPEQVYSSISFLSRCNRALP